MLSTSLTAFATSYNFTIKQDYAFGIIENYVVTVCNSGSKKNAFVSCCFPTSDECRENDNLISTFEFQNEIGKLIDSDYPELKNYEITSDSISFTTAADLKTFDDSLIALLKLLITNNIPGVDTCVECGNNNEESSKYVINNNKAHLLCGHCADEYLKALNKTDKEKNKTKRGRGSVFAFLGGLTGLLLSLIAFIFIVPASGVLGFNALVVSIPFSAVITVLGFVFYRLATHKKGLERIMPCLIISALFAAISAYTASAIIYAKAMGITAFEHIKPVFSAILYAPFNDPFFKSDFLTYLFYSFVIVVIVVLIYSIIFEEKNKTAIEVLDAKTFEPVNISEETDSAAV